MTVAGREEGFTRLVQAHADAVYRYLRRRYPGNDGNDAEDLLADVMTVAWRRFDDIPEGAELPWLFGVARRRLANARNRGARRSRLSAPLRPEPPSASAEDEVLADLSLHDALEQLTDKEREALTLTAWEGLRPDELAVALGVSTNAAAIRLSKAKSKLLALLGSDSSESPRPIATRTS